MSEYQLRGNRVAPLSEQTIENVAKLIAKVFCLNRRNKKNIDKSFERLLKMDVTLNIVCDSNWIWVTKGHYEPASKELSVPEKIYENACIGERSALAVMLHEMGHLFLGHKALLHSSNTPCTQNEDAEWQADMFAEKVLAIMGYKPEAQNQGSFDFYK